MGQVARFTVPKTREILHDLKLVLTSFFTWLIVYPHGGWHHQWLLLHPTNCSHQRTQWREGIAQEHACAQLLSSPSLASSYAPHRIDGTVDVCVFLQRTELCFANSFSKSTWVPPCRPGWAWVGNQSCASSLKMGHSASATKGVCFLHLLISKGYIFKRRGRGRAWLFRLSFI